ncbi:MAG: hypothetical protein Q8O37_06315 [Sulfuricellaceae bacterium]|nr:hypothetical protein [Sulfuricellaceae bacterium]
MRDFTKVGAPQENNVKAGAPLEKSRQIVLNTLYGSALMFGAGGIWLLLGEQNFFPSEVAPILGIAFIVASAMDVVAVAVMKRVWARDMRR